MGVYRFNGKAYDMDETNNYMNFFVSDTIIRAKSERKIKASKEIGYCDKCLYRVTITAGIKHAVTDYRLKSLLVLRVKETYVDSNGKKYIIYKLINLGAYVEEKNKPAVVNHLSDMLGTQLVDVEVWIVNNSDFSIRIKDFGLYKSMSYANGYVENDLKVIPSVQVFIEDESDIGDGLYHEVWVNNRDTIEKMGELETWNTTSLWKPRFVEVNSNNFATWYTDRKWTAFDDKGNYIGNSDSESFNLPDYSEYIIFDFGCNVDVEDITAFYSGFNDVGQIALNPNIIVYMNNLGRVYKGNAQTYNYRFKTFDTDEFAESAEKTNEIVAYNKYDNYAGVLTFQLVVDPWYEDEEAFLVCYYCSTQPFVFNLWYAEPVVLNGHVIWVLSGQYNETEGVYYKSDCVDIERTTSNIYNNESKDIKYIFKKYFEAPLKELTEKRESLEVKYIDGNKNNDNNTSGGGGVEF